MYLSTIICLRIFDTSETGRKCAVNIANDLDEDLSLDLIAKFSYKIATALAVLYVTAGSEYTLSFLMDLVCEEYDNTSIFGEVNYHSFAEPKTLAAALQLLLDEDLYLENSVYEKIASEIEGYATPLQEAVYLRFNPNDGD